MSEAMRVTDKRGERDPDAPPPTERTPVPLPEMSTGDGQLAWQCDHCGNRARIKNLHIRHSQEPCEYCSMEIDDPPTVADEAGWCGCGEPDRIDMLMRSYLAWRAMPFEERPKSAPIDDDVAMLVAYIADDLGWTEHGTSIYGAWLTDGGREALQVLQTRD